MTEQHISFTSDEEIDESLYTNYVFPPSPSFSPLSSPKRNQSTHARYDDHEIPVDGMCFSSVPFDWGVGVGVAEEEAQPTVAHFSLHQSASANRSTDTQPLLPSNSYDTCSPAASSPCHWEIQQPFTMQRTYPSYSAQPPPIASNSPHNEFLSAVQRSTCSTPTSYDSAHLPCNGTITDPKKSNIACDSPEIEFFRDEQPGQEEVQSVESSDSLLKKDVPDVNLDQDHHPTALSVPYDQKFLDPVYSFIRSSCLEVFVIGIEHNASGSEGRGRGIKPLKEGQIGLRCAFCKHIPKGKRANQAVSYPSKTLHIFESVRNYQRIHFEACEYIPTELKKIHRELVSEKDKSAKKVQRKYIKAYFAETACEIGMVEKPNGLFFGARPNTSGKPSEKLRAIMSLAENPSARKDRQLQDLLFPKVDERIGNSKFSHIASEKTRQVIKNCRGEKAAFVYPSDFPTISDFRFVLYHQFAPCRPSPSALRRRKIKPDNLHTLSGLCCKYCAKAHLGEEHDGLFFPLDLESLNDSAFFNSLTSHIVTCRHVPLSTKEALKELQDLGAEHGVLTKRGVKRMFLKKLWNRMSNYYPH